MAIQIRVDSGDNSLLKHSFRRTLLAENKAPRMIAAYLAAVDELGPYLAQKGMPGFSPISDGSTSSHGSPNYSAV